MRNVLCFATVLALVLNIGCGKAEDATVEQAVERAVENSTGGEAGVDVSEEGMEISSTDEDGTYTWKGGDKAEIPEGFPDDVYVYEGAEILMASEAPGSFMLALSTDAALSTVVETYQKEMSSAGWTQVMSNQMDGGQMLVYAIDDRSANVTIFDEDGVRKISLSVGG